MTELDIVTNLTQLDLDSVEDELTEEDIKRKWKALSKVYHPDATNYSEFQNGGKQAKVTAAKDFLIKNLDVVNYYIRKKNHKLNEEDLKREAQQKAAQEEARKKEEELRAKREQEEKEKRAQEEARKREEELRAKREREEKAKREQEERARQASASSYSGSSYSGTYGSSNFTNKQTGSYSQYSNSSSYSSNSSSYSSNNNSANAGLSYSQTNSSSAKSVGKKGIRIAVTTVVVLLGLAALVLIFMSIARRCSGDEGSPSKVKGIEISDYESLLAIDEDSSKEYKLTADIDLSGTEWTPLKPFSGKLHGNGYTISGLTMTSFKTDYAGLFQEISAKGSVDGLKLTEVNVQTFNTAKGIGGVAGSCSGTISSCEVQGTISVSGAGKIGGIVGVTPNTATIENCKFNGTIEGGEGVGGILGGEPGADNGFTVKGCEVKGSVSGSKYVGGVVGVFQHSNGNEYHIENCVNYASVNGTMDYVGGILGRGYSGTNWGAPTVVLTGCANHGEIIGKDYTGGVVGAIDTGGSHAPAISACSNEAKVTGYKYVGGILGYSDGAGEMSGLSSKGDITGTEYVGGYAGYADSAIISGVKNESKIYGGAFVGGIAGHIRECYDCENTGLIESSGPVDNYSAIGGIAGRIGVAKNCVNRGEITTGKNKGNGVGGIAGLQHLYAKVEIINCKNYGEISVASGQCIGGILGYIAYTGGILSSSPASTVSGCVNYGNISISDEATYVGGVLGRFYDNTWPGGGLSISSCGSECVLTAKSSTYVGGILGFSSSEYAELVIQTVWVKGEIYGSRPTAYIIAGFTNFTKVLDYVNTFTTEGCVARQGAYNASLYIVGVTSDEN